MTAKAPPLTERDFQRQVCELATIRGWSYLHIRAARTADSWRTPISGPLGKGWPDLVLVRGSQLIAVELKRDGAKTTPDQERVLKLLEEAIPVFTFRPADWSRVEAVLR
jgi:hypothetical protein